MYQTLYVGLKLRVKDSDSSRDTLILLLNNLTFCFCKATLISLLNNLTFYFRNATYRFLSLEKVERAPIKRPVF